MGARVQVRDHFEHLRIRMDDETFDSCTVGWTRSGDIRPFRVAPQEIPDPASFTGRVMICWEWDFQTVVEALIEDEFSRRWDLPGEPRPGDVAVTVLGSDPPLVLTVENLDGTTSDKGARSDRLVVLTEPVSWAAIGGERLDTPITGESRMLSTEEGVAILTALRQVLRDQDVVFATADVCGAGDPSSAVRAIHAIQARDTPELYLGDGHFLCASCETAHHFVSLMAHVDRELDEPEYDEIGELADSIRLVCPPCHDLLHPHDVVTQADYLRPPCPDCGVRGEARPIVYGMPAFLDDDGVVLGGCVTGPGPRPQWHCDGCGSDYLVISTRELSQLLRP